MTVPVTLVSGSAAVPLPDTTKFPRAREVGLPPVTAKAIALPPRRLAAVLPRMRLPVIATTSVALPGTPAVAPAPVPDELAIETWIPWADGKLVITLPEIVARVRLKTVVAVPVPTTLMPWPREDATLVELMIVLFDSVALLIVPSALCKSMPLHRA